jgi:Ricin-type beta-trefoil lectin domain-like
MRRNSSDRSVRATGGSLASQAPCAQPGTRSRSRSGVLEGVTAGADALLWGDNGTSDHLWQLISTGNGQYKIENYNSGLLLGVLNASKSSGAQTLQWTDNGTADHLWTLTAS